MSPDLVQTVTYQIHSETYDLTVLDMSRLLLRMTHYDEVPEFRFVGM